MGIHGCSDGKFGSPDYDLTLSFQGTVEAVQEQQKSKVILHRIIFLHKAMFNHRAVENVSETGVIQLLNKI